MDNSNKELLEQLADTKFTGEVTISVKKKYKPTKYVPFRMFGMDKTNMSLLKALDLIENSKWKVRALRILLSNIQRMNNMSVISDEISKLSPSDRVRLNAALKYLSDNNIAVRITKQNAKAASLPYQKNNWVINPNIVYIPDAHEAFCISWKLLTGNEP